MPHIFLARSFSTEDIHQNLEENWREENSFEQPEEIYESGMRRNAPEIVTNNPKDSGHLLFFFCEHLKKESHCIIGLQDLDYQHCYKRIEN